MADFSIRPSHQNKKVFIHISRAKKKVRWGLRLALIEIGKENTLHLQALIRNPPKTGRIYRFQGKPHQASAPFEAPANRSGDLQKTAGFRAYGHTRMEFGDRMFYGKYLEEGTKKMKKRPHIIRTVREKSRDNFVTLVNTVHRAQQKL